MNTYMLHVEETHKPVHKLNESQCLSILSHTHTHSHTLMLAITVLHIYRDTVANSCQLFINHLSYL